MLRSPPQQWESRAQEPHLSSGGRPLCRQGEPFSTWAVEDRLQYQPPSPCDRHLGSGNRVQGWRWRRSDPPLVRRFSVLYLVAFASTPSCGRARSPPQTCRTWAMRCQCPGACLPLFGARVSPSRSAAYGSAYALPFGCGWETTFWPFEGSPGPRDPHLGSGSCVQGLCDMLQSSCTRLQLSFKRLQPLHIFIA